MIIKINLKGKDRELSGDTMQPGNRWYLTWAEDRKELNISSGLTLSGWEAKQRYFKKEQSQ